MGLKPHERLEKARYSRVPFGKKTNLVTAFSRWLHQGGVAINEITGEHEDAFLCDHA